jgi:hypothetical protein
MAGKDVAVKKYVVRLSAEERAELEALIRKGKSPAQRLLKARIFVEGGCLGCRRGLERQPDHQGVRHQCLHVWLGYGTCGRSLTIRPSHRPTDLAPRA